MFVHDKDVSHARTATRPLDLVRMQIECPSVSTLAPLPRPPAAQHTHAQTRRAHAHLKLTHLRGGVGGYRKPGCCLFFFTSLCFIIALSFPPFLPSFFPPFLPCLFPSEPAAAAAVCQCTINARLCLSSYLSSAR